jgi:hypothetical protein
MHVHSASITRPDLGRKWPSVAQGPPAGMVRPRRGGGHRGSMVVVDATEARSMLWHSLASRGVRRWSWRSAPVHAAGVGWPEPQGCPAATSVGRPPVRPGPCLRPRSSAGGRRSGRGSRGALKHGAWICFVHESGARHRRGCEGSSVCGPPWPGAGRSWRRGRRRGGADAAGFVRWRPGSAPPPHKSANAASPFGAAAAASTGSLLPRRRRVLRSGRSASSSYTPWPSRNRVSTAP